MFDVACVGILVADVIAKTVDKMPESGKLGLVDSIKLQNGGGAMSCAIDLAKIGAKSAIIGKVGEDGFGQYLTGVLVQNRVNIDCLVVDSKPRTCTFVVRYPKSQNVLFTLHVNSQNGVDTFVDNLAILAHFEHNSVKKNNGICHLISSLLSKSRTNP